MVTFSGITLGSRWWILIVETSQTFEINILTYTYIEKVVCIFNTILGDQQEKNFVQLRHQIEETLIPKIIRLYNFDGPNKNIIKATIIWKYLSSVGNDDIQSLKKKIHDLYRDSKMLAPSNRLLKTLVTTTRAPVFSYYLQLSQITTNISGNFTSFFALIISEISIR